jgi:hypothetical protein
MFDSHSFKPVTFWSLGPLKNPKGYTIAIAEIDDSWIMRWKEPWSTKEEYVYCSNYEHVIREVKKLY